MSAASRTSTALVACIGSLIFTLPLGATSAEAGVRRLDWNSYGIDMTPVGTARQVERLKRMRLRVP